ncbi:uncharacterized protein [Penaeus vannamei]|uniref:uncharacterized protein n=1 Tax=Penaeus vannamei TaxID=6689 RepID=UPI00387F4561
MTYPYLLAVLAWVAAGTVASGTPRILEASFVSQVNSASASAFTEVLATHSSATSPSKRNSSDSASERDAPHTYKRGAPEPSDLSLVGSASPGPGEVKVVKRSAQSQPLVRYLPQNLVTVLERACTSTSTVTETPGFTIVVAGCRCEACDYVAGQDPCRCLPVAGCGIEL